MSLITAVGENDVEEVRRILDEGGDPNHKSKYGYSVISLAVEHGYLAILKLLHQKGGDLDTRTVYGRNALMTTIYT